MRIGSNPNIHKNITLSSYSHRVIIPVYIPNLEGYFTDSVNVFKVCIESLIKTINSDTAISIVSNGSHADVNEYIRELFVLNKIDRAVFNAENVGKMNAIIAETRASFEEFITYADADVFFDQGWLLNTYTIFKDVKKAGFVSMNPSPANYSQGSSAIINNFFSWFFDKSLTKDLCASADIAHFSKSIGKDENYIEKLLNRQVVYAKNNKEVILGAGHFCCTIRKTPTLKNVPKIKSTIGVSGNSEAIYLDIPFEKSGLWRLSSSKAYVWHMGNTLEKEWATEKMKSLSNFNESNFYFSDLKSYNGIIWIKAIPYKFRVKIINLFKKLKFLN